MISKHKYGWEKLHGAILALTTIKPLGERAYDACSHYLDRIDSSVHLPSDIKDDFDELMNKMEGCESKAAVGKYKGVVELDPLELADFVEKILGYYRVVCSYREG